MSLGKRVARDLEKFAETSVSILAGYLLFTGISLARSSRQAEQQPPARATVIQPSAPIVPDGVRVDFGGSGDPSPPRVVVDAEFVEDDDASALRGSVRSRR